MPSSAVASPRERASRPVSSSSLWRRSGEENTVPSRVRKPSRVSTSTSCLPSSDSRNSSSFLVSFRAAYSHTRSQASPIALVVATATAPETPAPTTGPMTGRNRAARCPRAAATRRVAAAVARFAA